MINNFLTFFKLEPRKPKYRGEMICYYNDSDSEPIIVIGPHWRYAVGCLLLIDLIVGILINSQKRAHWGYEFCSWTLILWNFLSVYLILANPGLSPRSPSVHDERYIRKLQAKNMVFKLCVRCKLIQ